LQPKVGLIIFFLAFINKLQSIRAQAPYARTHDAWPTTARRSAAHAA
jgi:hypothetical protein